MYNYLINRIKTSLLNKLQKYMADDYVHKEEIKKAMQESLKRTEDRVNKFRDSQEEAKINEIKMRFQIQEDSYIAEIARLEKIVDNSLRMRKDVMSLKFELERRSKEFFNFISFSEHDEMKILSNVSSSIGELESLRLKYKSYMQEIDDNNNKEREALRLNA